MFEPGRAGQFERQLMSNMSYCRFRNTLSDLRDCLSVMDETAQLDEEETAARQRLISLCSRIAREYDDHVKAEDGEG